MEYLVECLASFHVEEQKLFLKFTTGMTSLSFGGLAGLDPPLSISRLACDHPDSSFPISRTCRNEFCLPDYSSLEVTTEKVSHATLNQALIIV